MDARAAGLIRGRRLSRRAALRLGAGATGAALLSALLAACGTSERNTGGGGQSAGTVAGSGDAGEILFLSTQFSPVEEAEKMRKTILAGFKGKVEFLPQELAAFNDRLQSESKAGKVSVSLIGGQHGDYSALVKAGLLEDVTPLVAKLQDRGFPQAIADLGKLGTDKNYYVPWTQATYIMAANKKALEHLPTGAKVETLAYTQLKDWGAAIQQKTGQRRLGFPAAPNGLLHRFFQGYLYPSYTKSSGVTEFKSADAVKMWGEFKDLWAHVNPQSTSYGFMQEPLLAEEVWVAWDHVARLINAVKEKSNDFVLFPAPAAGKGRGFMPVIAGLAIPKGAPNKAGAEKLIEYLTMPEQQIATLRELSFFPVTNATIPGDLPAGIKAEAETVKQQSSAQDAIPSLLPVGLGGKGGEFNKVYLDSFQRIVLKNEPPQQVLDEQAKTLQALMNETQAPCWAPDPVGSGPCTVK